MRETFKKMITVLIVSWMILLLVDFARASVPIPVSALESRYIWDSDAGMKMTFNLTPLNFDGFYYDINNDLSSEIFSINLDSLTGRPIRKNGVIYSTSVKNVPFKYRPFGDYNVVSFMGDKYFAGYTAGSKIKGVPVNLVNRSLFGKILIDENSVHSVTNGSDLTLKEDYVLSVKVLNITAGTVLITLEKHGDEADSRAVKAGNTYVYEKDIRKVIPGYSYIYNEQDITIGKIPIIAVHIDSVSANAETGIKGIFQLSDVYTSIDPGFGIMKIKNISDTGITMSNVISMTLDQKETTSLIDGNWYTLSQGGTYHMMGDIKLKVADSDSLRFYLYKEAIEYGDFERRGAVYTESTPVTAWDGLNFGGFWYDPDSNSYSESLEITNLTGRIIPEGGLKHTAIGVDIPFDLQNNRGTRPKQLNGSYKAFGLGTNKYAVMNGTSNLKLAKILVDDGKGVYNKKILAYGETWEMEEGYNLKVKSINPRSSPGQACLVFSQDGFPLDEKCLPQGDIYSYPNMNSSREGDPPLFVTYLDVLYGSTIDMIQLSSSWLRSGSVTEIHVGDRLGVFNITKAEPDHIEMKNDHAIDLIPGSRKNLIGDLGFVVADSDELRFYPSNKIPVDVVPEVTSNVQYTTLTEEIQQPDVMPDKTAISGYGFALGLTAFGAIYFK